MILQNVIVAIVEFNTPKMKTKERIALAIVLLAMLLLIRNNAQGQALSITQDPKLALIGDDRGNNPFTLNVRAKVHLTGNEGKIGYATVNMVYEYADLQQTNYNRYGVQAGYTFYTFADGLEFTPPCRLRGANARTGGYAVLGV